MSILMCMQNFELISWTISNILTFIEIQDMAATIEVVMKSSGVE